jgi:hypothetical protein
LEQKLKDGELKVEQPFLSERRRRSCKLLRKTDRHVNCPGLLAVSKHAIRIPALRAGRRVRWTFEVSADVGGTHGARAKKTPKKRQKVRPTVKKTKDSTATVPETTAAAAPAAPVAPKGAPVRRTRRQRAIVLAAIALVVVAMMAFPRRPSAPSATDSNEPPERGEAAGVAGSPQRIAAAPASHESPVASAVVAPRAVSEPAKKKLATNRITESAKSAAAVTNAAMIADAVDMDDSTSTPAVPEPAVPASTSASAGSVMPPPVTVTGCLEISTDEDAFRLTDTEGVDAPKSRSWRTGFLKKRPAPIALVDLPDAPSMKTNIGKRVAATGLLTSHALKVNSLRVVGRSCN